MVEQKVTHTNELAENIFTALWSKEIPQIMMLKIILIIYQIIQVMSPGALFF